MNNRSYMAQLDALRLMAIVFVMMGHWDAHTLTGIFGSSGVNLFFVISGFLITGILMNGAEKQETSKGAFLKKFYIRRFLRIFPLYYFTVFIGIIFSIYAAREHFISLLTYTANFMVALTNGDFGYYYHMWSLAVEEQFYVFFPLLILFFPKKYYLKIFYILIVLALVSRAIPYLLVKDLKLATWISYAFTPCCFDAFAIGSILAYMKIYERQKLDILLNKKYIFAISLALGVGFLTYSLYTPNIVCNTFYRFFVAGFFFWLVGKAGTTGFKGITGKVFENKTLIYLGKITYGMYVYHLFVPIIFIKLGFDPYGHIKYLYPFVTFIFASISWHAFEKPINNLKNRFEYI